MEESTGRWEKRMGTWGLRDVPRAAPYLWGSAAFLADGCQVAQDQLGGFSLP